MNHCQPPAAPNGQQTLALGRPAASASNNQANRPDTTVDAQSEYKTQPESDASNPWVGKRFDKYAIERLLGGGGMGEVFLGKHLWLEIPVAIKLLRPTFAHDPTAVERFRRESTILALLSHPNLVKALDGGHTDSTCFLVTEFLDGMTLAEIVAKRGPLAPDQACAIVCEVAKGLQYAHEKGLIHRDIKPDNVMVLQDGSVKILDLGLARVEITDEMTRMTSTGQFMGTVDYVSPEQALNRKDLDSRADIYSLGCTLYFLLTGKPPYHGDDYESVVSKILAHTEEVATPIDMVRSGTPKKLIRAVEKMMEKRPEDRIQTAAAIRESLQPIAGTIDASLVDPNNSSFYSNIPQPVRHGASLPEQFKRVIAAILTAMLCLMGILKRVETPSHLRTGGPRFRTRFNVSGAIQWLILGGLAWFLLANLEIVEYGPEPTHGPPSIFIENRH